MVRKATTEYINSRYRAKAKKFQQKEPKHYTYGLKKEKKEETSKHKSGGKRRVKKESDKPKSCVCLGCGKVVVE